MNYEKAKQLEDAGLTWDDDQPSLSELIEACGENFGGLVSRDECFMAFSNDYHAEPSEDFLGQVEGYRVFGSTPEIAVANLKCLLYAKEKP